MRLELVMIIQFLGILRMWAPSVNQLLAGTKGRTEVVWSIMVWGTMG